MILALETSTTACGAALGRGDQIMSRTDVQPRAHHALLLPMVDALLQEAQTELAQLEAIAFGCGPGSFTGLRIAASVAQGLAYGAGLPVIAVSSLHAMAATALASTPSPEKFEHVLVAVDAHMGDVYWAAFRCAGDALERMEHDQLSAVADFDNADLLSSDATLLAGDAWTVYAPTLARGQAHFDGCTRPDAADVIRLAERIDRSDWLRADQVEPAYVRAATVWKKIDEQ